MAGGNEERVDGVAGGAGEVIAFEQAISLGMADNRLDSVSPFQLALDGGGADPTRMCDIDLGLAAVLVASVTAKDIGTPDRNPGQPLDLATQCVTIIGVAIAVTSASIRPCRV